MVREPGVNKRHLSRGLWGEAESGNDCSRLRAASAKGQGWESVWCSHRTEGPAERWEGREWWKRHAMMSEFQAEAGVRPGRPSEEVGFILSRMQSHQNTLRKKWSDLAITMEKELTPGFLPRESHGQRSLAGYSPWDCKELDTTEWPSTAQHHFLDSRTYLFNENDTSSFILQTVTWELRRALLPEYISLASAPVTASHSGHLSSLRKRHKSQRAI